MTLVGPKEKVTLIAGPCNDRVRAVALVGTGLPSAPFPSGQQGPWRPTEVNAEHNQACHKAKYSGSSVCFITRAFPFEGPRVIQARGEAALKVLDSSLSLQMMLSRSPTRNATCSLMRVASRRPSFVVCSRRLLCKAHLRLDEILFL